MSPPTSTSTRQRDWPGPQPKVAARSGTSGVADVELGESDGQLVARAPRARFERRDTLASFTERIKECVDEQIVLEDLDALFLRNESIDDLQERPWASPFPWCSARCSRRAASPWSTTRWP